MIQCKFIHKRTYERVLTYCILYQKTPQIYTYFCMCYSALFSLNVEACCYSNNTLGHNQRKAILQSGIKGRRSPKCKSSTQTVLTIFALTLNCQLYFFSLKALHKHTDHNSLINELCLAVCHYCQP